MRPRKRMEMSEQKGREGEIRTSQTGEDGERRQRDNGELEQGVGDEERRGKERS